MEHIIRNNRYVISLTVPRNTEVLPVHQQLNSANCGIFAFSYVQVIVTEKKTTVNAELSTLKIRAQFLPLVKYQVSGHCWRINLRPAN